MKLLVLDNYDSFTYNLVHYVEQMGDLNITVVRNDKISIPEVNEFDKILLSPGPGIPSEAGILMELIKTYAKSKSIFGVCLGMQAIGEVFGGKLLNLDKVYHGIATPINIINDNSIFKNIPKRFNAGRYHSWVVDSNNFPPELTILAEDDQKQVMALKHKTFDVKGVQFHPESILTEHGFKILENWIKN